MAPETIAWNSHDGRRRVVKLNDRTFHYLHCVRCKRDFVRATEQTEWRATHVGVFRFDLLDASTNQRWTSETCPGGF